MVPRGRISVMTIKTFFNKFDQFAAAPDAVAKMLAPLPGCAMRRAGKPVVSLRSTTGYKLLSLRDGRCRAKPDRQVDAGVIPVGSSSRVDAGGIPVWSSSRVDAGGIPVCSSSWIDAGGIPLCSSSWVDAGGIPVWSSSRVDAGGIPVWSSSRVDAGGIPLGSSSRVDAGGIPVGCRWSHSLRTRFSDAGGIPACSRWLNPRMRVTPPENRSPFSRTPAGVPAAPPS